MTLSLPFQLGIHPINWVGEDVHEHGTDTTFEQIMADISALGLKGTEMGRKYPKDVPTLQRELAARDIQLVSQWKSVFFTEPSRRAQELEAYREHVLFLKAMGAKVISTCEIGGSLHWDPRRSAHETEVARLNDQEWRHLAEGLNQAGAIAREHGLKLTYHHHGGTAVERPEEIDRLMELTDPNLVYLLYDTGHAYYGGSDPLSLLRKHYDRIAYVHLKDIRPHILEEARQEGVDFVTCIRKGVFTVPGDGCIDFTQIIGELVQRGYSGWALLEGEQDPAVHPAYEYARKALAYINSIATAKKEEV
ncbi:myo-inosose-2 dehydratase [Paenibacillus sedimenti]|uniref:Myo-inosose-2 dehydratase n=1 Tax=Paenibacillus sedimenti TaxID=2770274 RepID=A0A926KQT7_9BACL|nr:myo-inosose-2 dehydratase [Paenibacillus sedimenti]MBD0381787.1 myo-inosose-2 dehydratase [Paenibacillus sedimenti]